MCIYIYIYITIIKLLLPLLLLIIIHNNKHNDNNTRVGMGTCKYLVDLYAIACLSYYTCKHVIHPLSPVSALSIM